MNPLHAILTKHKTKGTGVNSKESQWYGWIVIDIDPSKTETNSVSTIDDVKMKNVQVHEIADPIRYPR